MTALHYLIELNVRPLISLLQDSVSLHKKFIADCYKRLEVSVRNDTSSPLVHPPPKSPKPLHPLTAGLSLRPPARLWAARL